MEIKTKPPLKERTAFSTYYGRCGGIREESLLVFKHKVLQDPGAAIEKVLASEPATARLQKDSSNL